MKVAAFTLAEPIDYEAPDGDLVDLFFILLVPEHENHAHLDALAFLSEIYSNSANRDALRRCTSDTALYDLLQNLLQAPPTQSTRSA